MTEFAAMIKNCDTEENMAECAEKALHQALERPLLASNTKTKARECRIALLLTFSSIVPQWAGPKILQFFGRKIMPHCARGG